MPLNVTFSLIVSTIKIVAKKNKSKPVFIVDHYSIKRSSHSFFLPYFYIRKAMSIVLLESIRHEKFFTCFSFISSKSSSSQYNLMKFLECTKNSFVDRYTVSSCMKLFPILSNYLYWLFVLILGKTPEQVNRDFFTRFLQTILGEFLREIVIFLCGNPYSCDSKIVRPSQKHAMGMNFCYGRPNSTRSAECTKPRLKAN